MSENTALLKRRGWGETLRRDRWWIYPASVFLILSGFVIYTTWAAFQGAYYQFANYLSPLYSPVLWGESHHAWFGLERPGFWPSWLPYSPALVILPIPAGFRLTCYYYRGSYYKAFWQDPPSCAVGEPRKGYLGERYLPLILQNAHRYFLYGALLYLIVLASDAVKGFFFDDDGDGHFTTFGIGVGSLVLVLNVVLLAGYTFGCHSLRHLVGGYMDRFSHSRVRTTCYDCVSGFNRRHMLWAWLSLFWVAFTDVYIRLCSMGVWSDFRIL